MVLADADQARGSRSAPGRKNYYRSPTGLLPAPKLLGIVVGWIQTKAVLATWSPMFDIPQPQSTTFWLVSLLRSKPSFNQNFLRQWIVRQARAILLRAEQRHRIK
jgi:hypothetical protein